MERFLRDIYIGYYSRDQIRDAMGSTLKNKAPILAGWFEFAGNHPKKGRGVLKNECGRQYKMDMFQVINQNMNS
jgi:hypothetical protein